MYWPGVDTQPDTERRPATDLHLMRSREVTRHQRGETHLVQRVSKYEMNSAPHILNTLTFQPTPFHYRASLPSRSLAHLPSSMAQVTETASLPSFRFYILSLNHILSFHNPVLPLFSSISHSQLFPVTCSRNNMRINQNRQHSWDEFEEMKG
ncbi:hypothetical protein E2C01_086861 [Portunus trituberculatus]|uniref:Uncharacterized protein n=1 Tax=Portunus trituberculatus TaxID=210409 RepID=A0A5B7J1Y7_PORTR|nr:hypothetical protein [Portunus trituberculatus]